MIEELAAAVEAGAALDFTRDPERPVLRYPRAVDSLVRPLLAEPRRPEQRRVLSVAVRYRRALLDGGAEAERLAGDLGPTLAEAVRRTLPPDASGPLTRSDAFSRNEFIRARAIGISGNTRQDASATQMRQPWVDLDPATVADALGRDAGDPHAVGCLRFDVLAAIRGLEQEIESGEITPGVRLVRGRPLADWLDLDELTRLLRAWDQRTRRRA